MNKQRKKLLNISKKINFDIHSIKHYTDKDTGLQMIATDMTISGKRYTRHEIAISMMEHKALMNGDVFFKSKE